MTHWFMFKFFLFEIQIGIQQTHENEQEREKCDPDCFSQHEMTEKSTDHCTEDKAEQHFGMLKQFRAMIFFSGMAPMELFGEPYTDLPDMVCCKCRGHRHTFCLTKCIVLHRGDEVDRNLRNLNRCGFR